jgi:hypothetical protein
MRNNVNSNFDYTGWDPQQPKKERQKVHEGNNVNPYNLI